MGFQFPEDYVGQAEPPAGAFTSVSAGGYTLARRSPMVRSPAGVTIPAARLSRPGRLLQLPRQCRPAAASLRQRRRRRGVQCRLVLTSINTARVAKQAPMTRPMASVLGKSLTGVISTCTLTVSQADLEEAGVISLSSPDSGVDALNPAVGDEVRFDLADPDGAS